MNSELESHRRIALVGFMGCGKTTVAVELGRILGCAPFDLDELITEKEKRNPGRIISEDGEQRFREIETTMLRDLLAIQASFVVALGGGAWTIEHNRKLIADAGVKTVWLDLPFDSCWRKVGSDSTSRPLAPSRGVAERLFRERGDVYRLAGFRVELLGDESPADAARKVADTIL